MFAAPPLEATDLLSATALALPFEGKEKLSACEANQSERLPSQQERGGRVFLAGTNVPGAALHRLIRLSLLAAVCV